MLRCLFFSYFNIIPVVEFVSKHFLNDVAIGDVTSSYMRLDAWDDVYGNIRSAPIVTLIGGPLAAALSVNTPAFEYLRQYLSLGLLSFGNFGLAGFVVCMPLPLATRTDERVRTLYFAMAPQLLVTGIFTDSLFQFSSLILSSTLGTDPGGMAGTPGAKGSIRIGSRPSVMKALRKPVLSHFSFIDTLRGSAAFLVAFFHTFLALAGQEGERAPNGFNHFVFGVVFGHFDLESTRSASFSW